eukprot:Transcript_17358.p2 GENE.Transcript_17358~~Transcript_17358.p2  ORF type:complete len:305 (-),score=111.22 Transcript_17358:65-979(-)
MRLLLERGANANARDHERVAPLSVAAGSGAAALLLDAGADIEAASQGGLTALAHAVLAADAETVELLLARGASVHEQPALPRLGLAHLAAAGGDAAVLRLLLPRLPRAALSEQRNARRAAPLHCAAEVGAAAVARLLLAAGGAPSPLDSAGRTPLDLAESAGHAAAAAAIGAAGGERAAELAARAAAARAAAAEAREDATETSLARSRLRLGVSAAARRLRAARGALWAALTQLAAWAAWLLWLGQSPRAYRRMPLREVGEGEGWGGAGRGPQRAGTTRAVGAPPGRVPRKPSLSGISVSRRLL